MPYIQPKTNNYFGFAPATGPGTLVLMNPYLVSSSEGAIYAGDILTLTSIGTVRSVTGAFASTMIGVAAHFMAANGGSTAALLNSNSTSLMLVYDDPAQIFVGTVTTSFLMGSTSIYKTVAVLSSGAVGSTGPNTVSLNRSVMAISGATASSAAGPLKLIGLHPVENNDFSTDAGGAGVAGSARKWLVVPAIHFKGLGAAGTLITS